MSNKTIEHECFPCIEVLQTALFSLQLCQTVVKNEGMAVQLATHQGNRKESPPEAVRALDPHENHYLISCLR